MAETETKELAPPLTPSKRILSRHHLAAFLASDTHATIVAFIASLNQSIASVALSAAAAPSPAVQAVLDVLDRVDQIAQDTPPVENGKSRFGNPAFRTFYDSVALNAPKWHAELLPSFGKGEVSAPYLEEVCAYFRACWGDRERVDYGSGMELNFLCWLLCLRKLGVLKEEDDQAVVAHIFWRYMMVTRRLQTQYWLEPAGSHGAQGLDDYHFAVFIFGSSQLRDHKYLRPKAIHNKEILDEFGKDFMYLSYVGYINSIKTASLRWHSPMLDDISGVKSWAKVNEGMLKMYAAEVLAKLPVAQHILFGSLLPFPTMPADDDAELEEEGVHLGSDGHIHVRGEGFEDCCGIAIPSAFAAAQAAERAVAGGRIKRIPFD